MAKVRREVERVIRVLEKGGLNGRENGKVLVKKRVFRVRVGEQEKESVVAIISFRYFPKCYCLLTLVRWSSEYTYF